MNINNEITSALCDMEDIKNALSDDIKNQPKDNDGTGITIGDCIYDVIYLLKNLREQD
tara:strand:+ start:1229 stop:1402 length:174 start_codon:yes stop_codon:yes gene_type:complete